MEFIIEKFFSSPMIIVSTIFGLFGVVANMLIYHRKSRNGIIVMKLISDILWATHYVCLGFAGYAGAAIATIGIFRECVFMKCDVKKPRSRIWLVFFIIVSIVSACFTWKSWYSLLPATASIISVIAFFIGKPKLTRTLAFPISICMLTYDFTANSIIGIVNEIATMTSAFFGLLKLKREEK